MAAFLKMIARYKKIKRNGRIYRRQSLIRSGGGGVKITARQSLFAIGSEINRIRCKSHKKGERQSAQVT